MNKIADNHQVQIGPSTRAVALAASDDTTRMILNGVHINGDHIEATDGRILFRAKTETTNVEDVPPEIKSERLEDDVIIPTGIIRDIVERSRRHLVPALSKAFAFNNRVVTTDGDVSTEIHYKSITGKYPGTAGLVPKTPLEATVSLSPYYLGMIAKAAEMIKADAITLSSYGEHELLTFETEGKEGKITGALMPMRQPE